MVPEQTSERTSVKPKKIPEKILVPLLYILIIGTFILACFLIKYYKNIGDWMSENSQIPVTEEISVSEENTEVAQVKEIDFQPIIDDWASSTGGKKSVLIYDLENGKTVGAYNTNESYSTASLYKLFVAYEGYSKVQSGEWSGTEMTGSTGHTILECLDLAIRESNSACAETLWKNIGYDELDQIVAEEFGITNSDISGLTSNVNDIATMMRIYYEHQEITDEALIAQIKDSFLNQPTTTYDWRQGLPSGFTRANVYNKVGWDYNPDEAVWNIYHDAAIVEFPEENHHFVVVVMTNQVDYKQICDLGAKIEEFYYNN